VALLWCCATTPALPARAAQETGGGRLLKGLHFKAEASKVLSALARLAKASIVVPPQEIKTVVNVELNNVTVEEAIRIVAAAARIAYRKIGNVYVVAPPDQMAQVLAQYGNELPIPLQNIAPAAAAEQVRQAVPFITARPAGRTLLLIGAAEDLQKAAAIVQQLDIAPTTAVQESASMALTYAPATDIIGVLSAQFPTIKAQKVGESAIAFTGPPLDVQKAKEFVASLDTGKEATARYAVYQIKHISPTSVVQTLRDTFKTLTVVIGPEPYFIPLSPFNLTTANTIGNTGQGAGGGGGFGGGFGGGMGGMGGFGGGMMGGMMGGGMMGGMGGGLSGQPGSGERSRTLILGGTAESVQAALKLLESLDLPAPQIVLDCKVVSTTPQTAQTLGIDWSNEGQGAAASISSTFTEQLNPNQIGIGSFGRLPIQFSVALNAFFRRDDVRILAKPTITALDNETGVVFVGETRRVSVSSLVNNAGANNVVLNNVVEIPVGIILQMRPRVTGADQVTLHVHPIYSTGGAVDSRTGLFPTFQREADTTVRIKSGETLVIGGLLQDEDTKTLLKVPILGDIPLIGQFFRNYQRTRLRREVLVFVTPHILKDS
jgi:type II secretory pathway component GspD/PulD (secretin)